MRHCVTLGYVYLPFSRTMSSNNLPAAHAKEKIKNRIIKKFFDTLITLKKEHCSSNIPLLMKTLN